MEHLRGEHPRQEDVIGIYPLLPNGTCNFIVFDFDNHGSEAAQKDYANEDEQWMEEVNILRKVCEENNIHPLVERSRSGKGAHLWILFKEPVDASEARRFGNALLHKGEEQFRLPSFDYYDRLFPTQEALRENVQDTFNMVSVDGDTSTNDTLLILANGMAGNDIITEKNEDYDKFMEALNYVNTKMAKMMAGDGEGATALLETKVIHAKTKQDAKSLAKSVICSSLTKAAIFGHDANWGRILCALGYAGVDFDPEKVELFFQGENGTIQIFKDGVACDYSEEEASKILAEPEVRILVDMKSGEAEACAWGCDLTYDYVKINADYRS